MTFPGRECKTTKTPVFGLQYRFNTAVILSNFPKSALSIYKKLRINGQFVSVLRNLVPKPWSLGHCLAIVWKSLFVPIALVGEILELLQQLFGFVAHGDRETARTNMQVPLGEGNFDGMSP